MDKRTKNIIEETMKRPISFHPIFKKITGNTPAALFLSQAWYWKENEIAKSRQGWFYKKAEEWEAETGLTRREQETARRYCKNLGVLEEKLQKVYSPNKSGESYGHATLFFRVNEKRVYELIFSLAQSAKLLDSRNPPNYLDSRNPPNYLNIDYQRTPHKAGRGKFKTWHEAPESLRPFFQACIEKPIALPEPTTNKEIMTWLETFSEWTQKGFTPSQVISAARRARKLDKTISRPGSLTWLLNDHHSREHGQNTKPNTSESVLESLAKRERQHG